MGNSVCVNYVFFFSFFLRAVFAVFAIKYLTLFAMKCPLLYSTNVCVACHCSHIYYPLSFLFVSVLIICASMIVLLLSSHFVYFFDCKLFVFVLNLLRNSHVRCAEKKTTKTVLLTS